MENEKQVNFVTLTYARSGSSFFQRLLGNHPEVSGAQEMLAGSLGRGEAPSKTINYFYYSKPRTKVLGFKMMYYHDRPGVWEALMNIKPKPKVIQLIREDLLETVMLMPKMYDGKTEGGMGPPLIIKGSLALKIDKVIRHMEKLKKEIDKHRRLAGLVITYEEITGKQPTDCFQTNEVRKKVFDFLGVEDKKVISKVNKKNKRLPNEEIFTNWKEMLEEMKKRKIERYYHV